jgi:hypothetical protein
MNGRHSWMAMTKQGRDVIVCSAPGCGQVKGAPPIWREPR